MTRAEFCLPQINVNDDEAVLLSWHVRPGDHVDTGAILCEVETTKAAVELELTTPSGYVFPSVAENETVEVGQRLAWVLDVNDPSLVAEAEPSSDQPAEGLLISKKAQALMDRHDLTPDDLGGGSTIRLRDVEALLAQREGGSESPDAQKRRIDALELTPEAVLLYGAGRHGIVVKDVLSAGETWRPVAYVDDDSSKRELDGLPIFPPAALADLQQAGVQWSHICIANPESYTAIAHKLRDSGLDLMNAIDPSARISGSAVLGEGIYVGPLAVIGPLAGIGDGCHINNCASIAHHAQLERSVRIADGARIGGAVSIGEGTLIGLGATVNKDVRIGKRCVVVSGASVTNHIPDDSVVRSDNQPHANRRHHVGGR